MPADDQPKDAEEDEVAAVIDLPELDGMSFDDEVAEFMRELAYEALSEGWVDAMPMHDIPKQRISLSKVFKVALPSLNLDA